MINILMNQKPGLTDSVSCPTNEPAHEKWFSQTIQTYKPWVVIKWRQYPDVTTAVDWDVKH